MHSSPSFPLLRRAWNVLASPKLTLLLLGLMMALVLLCTFAQVRMGTFAAVNLFMRPFFVKWTPSGAHLGLPVFPGGALVGLLLAVNLIAGCTRHLGHAPRKAGLWLIHAGMALFLVGEFVTGALQQDLRMRLQEGQSRDYAENPRACELALRDASGNASTAIIPEHRLRSGLVPTRDASIGIRIERFIPHGELVPRSPGDTGNPATAGAGLDCTARAVRPSDEAQPAAWVEPFINGQSCGVWLISTDIEIQTFTVAGRTFELALRPQRVALPFAFTLTHFQHERYPGTDIPKTFASRVRLNDPKTRTNREVFISMNHPFRYQGRAFYQAGFSGDKVSVLQVVSNPGWLLPYVSCVMVSLGLLIHFALRLSRQGRATGETA